MSAKEGEQGANQGGPSAGSGRQGRARFLRAKFTGNENYAPSVSPTVVQVVLPAPVRFKQIEERLRTSLKDWKDKLVKLREEMEKQINEKPDEKAGTVPGPWFVTIDSVTNDLEEAITDFRAIKDDLEAAKVEADYGSILVGSWPANHYLDRMAYIGGAVTGVGGAAFFVGTGIIQQSQFWIVPAVVFWSIGLALLVYALRGLADWERGKFEFFAWKLAVPEQYRPRIFKKSPMSERFEKLPEQLRSKFRKRPADQPTRGNPP
jgi:hypothetical protein